MIQNKFWQGFFALAPLICLVVVLTGYFIFLFSFLGNFQEWEAAGSEPPTEFFGALGIFLCLILFVVLLSLASLIFYIVHAAQNPNLKQNNLLVVWILLFVFANGLGQLIYWIIEILNKKVAHTSTS